MLYFEDLAEIIFNRHEMHDVDELIVISGYVGPGPVNDLSELPLNSKVICGMYKDRRYEDNLLHSQLLSIEKDNKNRVLF